MKRRLKILLTIIIWFLVVAAAAVLDHTGQTRKDASAAYEDGCVYGSSVCLIKTMQGKSFLCVSDRDGNVENLFCASDTWPESTILKLDCSDGLYGVVAEPDPDSANEGQFVYRIASFDENGRLTGQTAPLRFMQEGVLTGFQAKDDGYYMTFVMDSLTDAGVCFVDGGQLTALSAGGESGEETVKELQCSEFASANAGRFLAKADYEDGVFFLYTDDSAGAEHFAAPREARHTFGNLRFSVKQQLLLYRERAVAFLLVLAVGYIILVIFWTVFRNRSHLVYTIIITELILLVITSAGFLQMAGVSHRERLARDSRYGQVCLKTLTEEIDGSFRKAYGDQNFYDSETYRNLLNRFRSFADGGEEIFTDICLVSGDGHQVLASLSGCNGGIFEDIYSDGTADLLDRLDSGSAEKTMDIYRRGILSRVTGVAVPGGFRPEYLLVGVIPLDDSWEIPRSGFIFALIVFLAGSAVCLLLLTGQNREWYKFVKAIQQVAGGGRASVSQTKLHSRDIRLAWNSLQEIDKIISRTNYSKYNAFRSSYRFLPKNLEKIFSRDSITEVRGGDAVRVSGTVALISSTEPEAQAQRSAQIMNRFVEMIEKHQKESEGFFISGQCDLNMMKLLFLEEIRNTVDSGILFLQEFYGDDFMKELDTCVLLHYSRFTFGVAGTSTQSFPFLLSGELREIEKYADWFQSLGLKMVITERVREREDTESFLRYIGYVILTDSNEKLNMYEVLDACSPRELQLKAETDGQFQKALGLFYQRDFYLARQAFSDVLKENPTDYMAKWYLFTCEKYLNETHLEGDVCRLTMEERSIIR